LLESQDTVHRLHQDQLSGSEDGICQ